MPEGGAERPANGTTTAWTDAGVCDGFDRYRDLPEQLLGYASIFRLLPLDRPRALPMRVLEYGCGPGKLALRLAEAGAMVTAVDISPGMLRIARRRRPHSRIDYRQIADGDLGFLADRTIDAATACYVFINTPEEARIRRICAEVHRVLVPGGAFFVLDTHPGTTGIDFSTFRSGEPGRSYRKGELREVRLKLPDGGLLLLRDRHWPTGMYRAALMDAGFCRIDVHELTLRDIPPGIRTEFERLNGPVPWQGEWERPPFILFRAGKAA